MHSVSAFLVSLTNIDKDGKLLIQYNTKNPAKNCIKFMLLNPSVYFQEIVDDARSVILAGGTMEPVCLHNHLTATLRFHHLYNNFFQKFLKTK